CRSPKNDCFCPVKPKIPKGTGMPTLTPTMPPSVRRANSRAWCPLSVKMTEPLAKRLLFITCRPSSKLPTRFTFQGHIQVLLFPASEAELSGVQYLLGIDDLLYRPQHAAGSGVAAVDQVRPEPVRARKICALLDQGLALNCLDGFDFAPAGRVERETEFHVLRHALVLRLNVDADAGGRITVPAGHFFHRPNELGYLIEGGQEKDVLAAALSGQFPVGRGRKRFQARHDFGIGRALDALLQLEPELPSRGPELVLLHVHLLLRVERGPGQADQNRPFRQAASGCAAGALAESGCELTAVQNQYLVAQPEPLDAAAEIDETFQFGSRHGHALPRAGQQLALDRRPDDDSHGASRAREEL